MESCRQEKDIINNQLVQKLEEIGLLNEKISTMQIALNRGTLWLRDIFVSSCKSFKLMMNDKLQNILQANHNITNDWKMFVCSKLKFQI